METKTLSRIRNVIIILLIVGIAIFISLLMRKNGELPSYLDIRDFLRNDHRTYSLDKGNPPPYENYCITIDDCVKDRYCNPSRYVNKYYTTENSPQGTCDAALDWPLERSHQVICEDNKCVAILPNGTRI